MYSIVSIYRMTIVLTATGAIQYADISTRYTYLLTRIQNGNRPDENIHLIIRNM